VTDLLSLAEKLVYDIVDKSLTCRGRRGSIAGQKGCVYGMHDDAIRINIEIISN
jgi:hypothetical protein